MNFGENKTVKTHFTCSFSSLLGFRGSRSGFFRCFLRVLRVFFKSGDGKNTEKKQKRNGPQTAQKPRRDDNEQVKYDISVLSSSKFIIKLWELVWPIV